MTYYLWKAVSGARRQRSSRYDPPWSTTSYDKDCAFVSAAVRANIMAIITRKSPAQRWHLR